MCQANFRHAFFVVIGVISLCMLGGCGNASSPSAVVKAFYMAANDGKYSDAEGMLAKEAKDAVNGPLGQMGGGFKGICDHNTKNGSISSVEVVSEDIRGEGATVVVTINYKDGSKKKDDKNGLIRRDGRWQLTIGE